jgi:purine-binding chemotaxis protein CheW
MVDKSGEQTQWLILWLHGREYGLPIRDVAEVLRMVAVTPMPEAPAWLCGVINLRGRIIPVIDLRRRLGLPPNPPGLNTPIIVVEVADRAFGLVADAAIEVLTLPLAALTSPDRVTGPGHAIVRLAHIDGRVILGLDLEKLCCDAEGLPQFPI